MKLKALVVWSITVCSCKVLRKREKGMCEAQTFTKFVTKYTRISILSVSVYVFARSYACTFARLHAWAGAVRASYVDHKLDWNVVLNCCLPLKSTPSRIRFLGGIVLVYVILPAYNDLGINVSNQIP